jgi:hypothetical protein
VLHFNVGFNDTDEDFVWQAKGLASKGFCMNSHGIKTSGVTVISKSVSAESF